MFSPAEPATDQQVARGRVEVDVELLVPLGRLIV